MTNPKRPRRTAGQRLKAARTRRGLTQTEAAAKVGAKSAAAWCDWEKDKKTPSAHFADAIAKRFGVPVSAWPSPEQRRAA